MKTKHIGLSIFSFCVLLLIKAQHQADALSRNDKEQIASRDWMGLVHGARYYVAGIGLLGLRMFAEDIISNWIVAKRKAKGVLPRSEINFLEWSDGTVAQNPFEEALREAASVLISRSADSECWLATGNGWTLRASGAGTLMLQNVSAGFGPWRMEGQSASEVGELWGLLRSKRISEIRDRAWKIAV